MHIAVTGVATGIGAALVAQLQSAGARVTGFDVALPEKAAFTCHRIDLADLDSIAATVSKVEGPFDGLCNNAGVSPKPGREAMILTVNFFAQRAFTRAVLPKLATGASIVNMASRAGARWRENIEQVKRLFAVDPAADLAAFIRDERIDHVRAYNLSKEAMIVWTLAETEAMTGRNMRINALCPGAVATGLLNDFAAAFGEQMARNVARAGRPGKPEEIAAIAAFLLSPQSAWLRGAEISPDGGMGAFAASDSLGLSALGL
ncbi:MAG: SDR family oxidoreductase [Rhodocyclaceae bacterium]|nr:MAG: SDR family oxidoreductase [Rhodocyclaceae bacterium]